jgi:hypothetical protein
MNLIQRTPFCIVIAIVISLIFMGRNNAQTSGSVRPVSLITYDSCQPRIWRSVPESSQDIPIGRNLYQAVGVYRRAFLSSSGSGQYTLCRLAQPGETPRFKTLTLSMGYTNSDTRIQYGTVLVTVYKNGNEIGSVSVSPGSPKIWSVDISDTETLGLDFQCIQPDTLSNGSESNSCRTEHLYFFEATVQ